MMIFRLHFYKELTIIKEPFFNQLIFRVFLFVIIRKYFFMNSKSSVSNPSNQVLGMTDEEIRKKKQEILD